MTGCPPTKFYVGRKELDSASLGDNTLAKSPVFNGPDCYPLDHLSGETDDMNYSNTSGQHWAVENERQCCMGGLNER